MRNENMDPAGGDGAPDPEVADALRSLTPPPHGFGFWADVEDRLSARPPSGTVRLAPQAPPPPLPPLAEVVPLAEPSRRPFPRWPALVAAAMVVVLGAAVLARTTGTDVQTTSAATSLPGETTTLPATTAVTTVTTVTTAPPVTAPVTTPKPTVPPSTAPPTTTRSPYTVTPDGVGPLRIGMTVKETTATGAMGPPADPLDHGGQCLTASPAGSTYTIDDFGALFLDGRLARLYVSGDRMRTPEGVGKGSASSKLKAIAGTRTESPHPYGSGTNVDIMRGNLGYQFTVDGGKVTEWSVGTKEGLGLPEACS